MYRATKASDVYSAGCAMYKLMMSKNPYDISSPFNAAAVVGKGDYEKIPKKSKGGIYSDEFVDIIHSMMDLVFLLFVLFYYFISRNQKTDQTLKKY
jgi:serine/threonine protein kinase